MITRKGTTVTIAANIDQFNQALSESLTQCDILSINIAYKEREKRIRKAWKERKQNNILKYRRGGE